MYTNLVNVQVIISLLKQNNISHVVISPGTRNVPFVHSVETDPFFHCYSIVDERSAAYFAIGLSEALNEPVCVSCTSSTATCNYMPAVKEAYDRGIQLVVLSADRDYHYLYQMEDQMIDQVEMYGKYVNCFVDLPVVRSKEDEWYCVRKVNLALMELNRFRKGPVQINFQVINPKVYTCSELPQYRKITRYSTSEDDRVWQALADKLSKKKRILVLCGQNWKNSDKLCAGLHDFFRKTNSVISYDYFANVYHPDFIKTVLVTESMEAEEFQDYLPDLVITLGSHLWSFVKLKLRAYPGQYEHWSITPVGEIEDAFMSLTSIFECEPDCFFEKINTFLTGTNDRIYYQLWKDRVARVKIPKLPFSNFLVVQKLMERVPENSIVHLTILNSIRLTQFSEVKNRIQCYANLGADGIDGSLSTFLGQASGKKDTLNFLVSGDLSFLYDANGTLIQLGKNSRFLVINNFAGAEFHKNFDTKAIPMIDDYIAAGHKTKIGDFVSDLDILYLSASNEAELISGLEIFCRENDSPIVFEVFTDAETDAQTLLRFYAENRSHSKVMKVRKIKNKAKHLLERLKVIRR